MMSVAKVSQNFLRSHDKNLQNPAMARNVAKNFSPRLGLESSYMAETRRPKTSLRDKRPRRTGPSAERLRIRQMRSRFFRAAIDPEQLLQAFSHLPGVLYFVKDAHSRTMALSHASAVRMGFQNETELMGRSV